MTEPTKTFRVTNKISGLCLGSFAGKTAVEAWQASAREAGYTIDESGERTVQTDTDGVSLDALAAWAVAEDRPMTDTDILTKLIELCEQADDLWSDCVENATEPGRRRRARRADRASTRLWQEALEAVEGGDFKAARAALQHAAELAEDWGYAGPEKAALALLEGDR